MAVGQSFPRRKTLLPRSRFDMETTQQFGWSMRGFITLHDLRADPAAL